MMKSEEELSSFFNQLFIIHEKNKSLQTRIGRLYTIATFKICGTPLPFNENEVLVSWNGRKIWINDLALQEFYRSKRSGIDMEDYMFDYYFEKNPEMHGYFEGKEYGI